MKIKIFLLILFILLSQVTDAQIKFEKTYGGINNDWGTYIQQTFDGGYICVGTTSSYGQGGTDIYLLKLDEFGDTIWTKTYGGTGGDIATCVRQTADSGYIISGSTTSSGNGATDVYLIRTNLNGDTIWTKTFGGIEDDQGNSVVENTDGSFFIAGTTLSFAVGFSAIYLIKTDSTGSLLWQKTYEKHLTNDAWDMKKTFDGNLIIIGAIDSLTMSNTDMIYLLKVNTNGDTIWTRSFSNLAGGLYGTSVDQTIDNGYILLGNLNLAGGTNKVEIVRISAYGNIIWDKIFGSSGYIAGDAISHTSDGGFVITGVKGIAQKVLSSFDENNHFYPYKFNEKLTNGEAYLLKVNNTGDSLWVRTFGGIYNDGGSYVLQTNDDGYIIAGWTEKSYNSNDDVYIIKTDENGYAFVSSGFFINEKINIFPNPSTGIISIQTSCPQGTDLSIDVYDIKGKWLIGKSKVSNNKTQIDLSEFGCGIYFLKILYSNGYFVTKVVIY